MYIQPTKRIPATSYIGNSLVDINNNFDNIDAATTVLTQQRDTLLNTYINALQSVSILQDTFALHLPTQLANLRLSLTDRYPVADENNIGNTLKNKLSLFLHSYNGNRVGLYNTTLKRWISLPLRGLLNFSLFGLAVNTVYDIFLYIEKDDTFKLKFKEWSNLSTPSSRIRYDGVLVNADDISQRYIGSVALQDRGTQQTFSGTSVKILLYNAYNQTITRVSKKSVNTSYRLLYPLIKNSTNIDPFTKIINDQTYWNEMDITQNSTSATDSEPILYLCGESVRCSVSYYNTVNSIVPQIDHIVHTGISINNVFQPSKDICMIYNQNIQSTVDTLSILNTIVSPGLHVIRAFNAGDSDVYFNTSGNSNITAMLIN